MEDFNSSRRFVEIDLYLIARKWQMEKCSASFTHFSLDELTHLLTIYIDKMPRKWKSSQIINDDSDGLQ